MSMVKEVFMLVGVVGVAGGAIGQPQISDLGFQFWRLWFPKPPKFEMRASKSQVPQGDGADF